MKITIDGQPSTDVPKGTTLRQVLDQLAQRLQQENKLICSVAVNGKTLADGVEGRQAATMNTDTVARLEIETANPRMLAIEVLKSAAGHFQSVADETQIVAKKLQKDELAAALPRIMNLTNVWMEINQAVQNSCCVLGVNLSEFYVDVPGTHPPESLSGIEVQEQLNNHLRQTVELMESEDYFELADLMEHDLTILARRCEEIVLRLLLSVDKKLN